jgi:hypothetical protein
MFVTSNRPDHPKYTKQSTSRFYVSFLFFGEKNLNFFCPVEHIPAAVARAAGACDRVRSNQAGAVPGRRFTVSVAVFLPVSCPSPSRHPV